VGAPFLSIKKILINNLKIRKMNNLRNSVRLIGNLGANPEIKELNSGRKLAKASLATSDKYKDADGNQVTQTQWHNLVAWGKTADFFEKFLEKGIEVALEGKIINKSYTDKDGSKKYISEINVNEILMLGSKKVK
jgi:single-strand DNA-binding protein